MSHVENAIFWSPLCLLIEIEQEKEKCLSSSSQPQGQEVATEEFLKIVISFSIRAFMQNQLIKN